MRTSFVRTLSLLFAFGLVSSVSLDRFATRVDASTGAGGFYGQNRAGWLTVPAGTRLLVRTSEGLSSARNPAGSRFGGVLDTNITAQGTVIVPRGTPIHGRVASANQAGAMRGSSHLTLELTDIIIGGTAYPIVTDAITAQGQGQGGGTVRNIGLGTGLGAGLGALAGGGRGAAIGGLAGGGLGTVTAAGRQGDQIFISQGTLLEFRLMQPVPLPAPPE